ncbi:hypothetical protein 000TH008_240 [Bacillus phage 000TH008]|nr:hypothetical protein 000TH008_240 [Bacillus phage 000TH008]QQO40933.1 hypothetical protein 000TH009_240 [Bacillus phage 000TH009]
MECNNQHCYWNVYGSCCHEGGEEAIKKATPNELDCPSSLRGDFEKQFWFLFEECVDLLHHRSFMELAEIKKFIESQRENSFNEEVRNNPEVGWDVLDPDRRV